MSTFLQDARRFALTFSSYLCRRHYKYTGLLDVSALKSIARHKFQWQRLQNVQVGSEQWTACLQTYEGHSSTVRSVVFSPGGSRSGLDSAGVGY
ncbi:hypothetical protein V1515DRAFT_596818 [Lipomyces mesembrius]